MKPFDPLGGLERLLDHEVDFVVIGGLAARLHGSPTVTDDLDICHSKERTNLEKLASALASMNAYLRLPDPDERVDAVLDWRLLHATDNLTLATDFGSLDCLARPAGITSFDEMKARATIVDLESIQIRVASLDDLIAMKQAAGRRKDLIELEVLAALKDEIGPSRSSPQGL